MDTHRQIDITFDFRSDTPGYPNKDPDAVSHTTSLPQASLEQATTERWDVRSRRHDARRLPASLFSIGRVPAGERYGYSHISEGSLPLARHRADEMIIRALEALYLYESQGMSAAEQKLSYQESEYGIPLIHPIFKLLSGYLEDRRKGKYNGLRDFMPESADQLTRW